MTQAKFWIVLPTAAEISAARGKISVDVFTGGSGEADAKKAAVRRAITTETPAIVAEATFEAKASVDDATVTAQLTPVVDEA